mgnify:CR=1 FL=1
MKGMSEVTLRGLRTPARRGQGQSGATLIEVLVSILLLSLGLLGMMGMHTGALRFEQGAWARSAISGLVADVGDRIRTITDLTPADLTSVRTYAEEMAQIADANYFTPVVDCLSSSCTSAQLAAYHRVNWRRNLHRALPGAAGFIQGAGEPGRSLAYQVVVAWADKSQVNALGVPTSPPVCDGTESGVAARNCCPTFVDAPAGVRCVSVLVTP